MAADARSLELVDRWWRAANYLSAGQIYLLDNPLLAEPLLPEHGKPRRRESLADVSSVKLTRNPGGLLWALRKLEANDQPFASFNHATAAICIDDSLQHHAQQDPPSLRHPPASVGAHRRARAHRPGRVGLATGRAGGPGRWEQRRLDPTGLSSRR